MVNRIEIRKPESLLQNIRKHPMLYLMVIPGLFYFVVFKYVPLFGSIIAFQNYQIFRGFRSSPWVGWDNFRYIFGYKDFYRIFINTVRIGGLQIVFGFPAPIILALMLNEVQSTKLKRSLQTALYLPHFLSWAIIGSIIFDIFSLHGVVNVARDLLNLPPVLYMQKSNAFLPIVTVSFVWKEIGWSAIVYLAAITGIDPQLYEAAVVEGANKWQRMSKITVPLLAPTIIVMLLLRIGNFLNLGFEQIYVLLTPTTQRIGDILDTWVYQNGVCEGKYSLTTAVGLFKSVLGMILMVLCNTLSKKTTGRGVY